MAYVPVDRKQAEAIYTAAEKSWYRSGRPQDQELDVDATVQSLIRQGVWSDDGENLLLQIYASDQADEILEKIQQAISKQPKNADLRVTKGAILATLTWSEQDEQKLMSLSTAAVAEFDAAISMDAYHWDAWMTKAAFYAGAEDRQYEKEALKMFQQLIDSQEQFEQRARYVKAYIEYGKLLAKHDQTAAATKILRRGLSHFPGNKQLLELLEK